MTHGATVTAPLCMTSDEVVAWWRANAVLTNPAKSPCADCLAHWRRGEIAANRCDREVQRRQVVIESPVTEKRCYSCKATKPLEAFARHRASRDGRMPLCRPCDKARCARWYAARKARAA